ncbi:unnamed protein product [Orchesella dallaii]|uniref:Proteasome assembly chaperone 2 n=1 Tax=Orchesella dallaii TaxID=48710 RepID=A0ABP1QUB6_9HEXA
MFKYFAEDIVDGKTFVDHTLFLSAVSVGNVGQLAVDVILANAGPSVPQKIGRVFHPGLEAVVGTDPSSSNGDPSKLVTSCEIFILRDKKHVIIHFHAPVTMKLRTEFVDFLCDWIERQKFRQVVCFSSTFASDRNDQQLEGVPLRFIATDKSETTLAERLKKLDWEQLERRSFPAPAVIEGSEITNDGILHLPGSGITLRMFEKCQTRGIPFLALTMFASEGDNTPEALTMFEAANKLFTFTAKDESQERSTTPTPICIPLTWSHFHGRSHPIEMY